MVMGRKEVGFEKITNRKKERGIEREREGKEEERERESVGREGGWVI